MATAKKQPDRADQLEGRNPVLEALRGPREVFEIQMARRLDPSRQVDEIIKLAERSGIPLRRVARSSLDSVARTGAHQGVIARVAPYRYSDMATLLALLEKTESPLVLVLDGVEDPRNFGALVRVAEGAGADAVVIPSRRSAGVTAAVASASAGAVEHMRIVRVPGVPGALERLKQAGLWLVGAEAGSPAPYYQVDMSAPVAVVVGGEGKGLARLVRERCDHRVSIPMRGRIGSLNVATAGAVLLYEAVRQRAATAPSPRK